MRKNLILALGLAGAAISAQGVQAQSARSDALPSVADRARVTTLVNVGQEVSAASVLFLMENRRPATTMDELVASGRIARSRLLTPDIVRQGGAWRIVQDGASYAEIPLAAADLQAPECQEATRQAGGVGKANPPFGCHGTAQGIVFRYRI